MIRVDLTQKLKEKNMTSKELANIIDITEANLSILRSGKAKAIRFTTLDAICKALDCEPGDILKFEEDEDNVYQ
ncbi:MAG: helix-turn-helix transcriptional regulator [Bacilli bacterium]|nr:helix-turn-helix transcriptional regulator [Bacilli bacterium]MBN2876357.1 helix-turn-helix transcriptional regulator [Bacilli bacterium]